MNNFKHQIGALYKLESDKNFLKRSYVMAKILVTGAGGFIGSHLTEYLVEKGHKVRAFIRYNSRNFWGWLEKSKYMEDLQI